MPDLTPEILADLRGKAETAQEVFLDRQCLLTVDAPLMLALIEAAQCAVQLDRFLSSRNTREIVMKPYTEGTVYVSVERISAPNGKPRFEHGYGNDAPAAVAGLVKQLEEK